MYMNNNGEFLRPICTQEKPYKHDDIPTVHPDAICILSLDYSDWYKCPHCGLEFKTGLSE